MIVAATGTGRRLGFAMMVWVVVFNAAFAWLGIIFDYPDVLRRPMGDVLALFRAGGIALIATWYIFAWSALAFSAIGAVLAWRERAVLGDAWLGLAAVAVITGVLEGMGLLRWTFAMPALAHAGAAGVVTAQAMHQQFGVAIGEHLGQAGTAIWALWLAWAIARRGSRWSAAALASGGVLLICGLPGHIATVIPFAAGICDAATTIGYIAVSLWALVHGIGLMIRRTPTTQPGA